MNKPDCLRDRINQINRAAVRHMNSQQNSAAVCHQPVDARILHLLLGRLVHHHNPVAVNLLRGQQRPVARSQLIPDLPMRRIKSSQSLCLFLRYIDPRNPADECADAHASRIQSRKSLDRKCRRRRDGFRHPELVDFPLRIASGVFIAARVVDGTVGRRRRQVGKHLGIFALRAGCPIEFSQRGIVTK